jgi:general secretion pathway protein D
MNARPATAPIAGKFLAAVLAGLLAACASAPTPTVQREGNRAVPTVRSNADGGATATLPGAGDADADADALAPRAQIHRGTGQVINREAAAAPPPHLSGATSGAATFNFEGESLHAVVKAILGDMLGQNYVIAPNVSGTVTLATPKAVSPAEAFNLLEQILAWNNARMVYSGGRYNIVPSETALAGTVAPRTGAPALARGFEARVVPLKYIAAEEMKKLLEPYARPNAIVSVDSGRNVITIAGSRSELENYMRTIEIFDVDWLAGMSVGVFPLQSGRATQVVADLEKVFGAAGKSPVAGMFRFMPLEGANAVLVITPQPRYLDQIQQWIERIDGAGEGVRLYSYELKYIKANDLAARLSDVFGGGGGGRSADGGGAPSLMPGLEPTEIDDQGNARIGGGKDAGGGSGMDSGSGGGLGDGMSLNAESGGGNGAVTLEVEGTEVGVSAVDETNTLLVRASPAAWASIRDVIERLDVLPMQVHIEAQVVEVTLGGELSYGVNWFFENAVVDSENQGTLGADLPSAEGRSIWGDLSGAALANGLGWTFLGRDAAAVISALDRVTDLQVLQTPSVLVRNNSEAVFNVGSRIPISSVTVNPNTGGDGQGTFSQVQYLDTGTILKVRPRITREGMVFLDIVQEVSTPGSAATADPQGNVRIDTRRLKTEAIIQSGETVMLAGLIRDEVGHGSSGVPGLSRIPVIGGLFGRQTSTNNRSEVIVLLTPSVVRNPQEARELTDEYGRRFRAMEPLYRTPGAQ